MEEQVKLLEQRVMRLEKEDKKLRSSTTIPFDIDQAFRARLKSITGLSVSSKGVNTEDQAVNEAGVAAYDVLGDPDGFLEINIGGTIYYLPYY